MLFAFALVLLMLALVNALLSSSWWYPPTVFAAVWGGALLLAASLQGHFYAISTSTVIIVVAGALSFSAGGFVSGTLSGLRSATTSQSVEILPRAGLRLTLDAGLLAMSACLVPYMSLISSFAAGSPLQSFWGRIRDGAVVAGDPATGGKFSILGSLVPLWTILAILALYEQRRCRYSKYRTAGIIILAITYQLITTSRSGLLLLLVGLCTVAHLRCGRNVARNVVVAFGLLFVMISVANHLLLGKAKSHESSTVDNARAVLDSFAAYSIGGLVAFDDTVQHPGSVANGWKLTNFFVHTANKFGADLEEPSQNLGYTAISPEWATNVYTIYFAYYAEFGLGGVLVITFFLGSVTSLCYWKALRGNPVAALLYIAGLFGIVMSTFGEEFFLQAGFWAKSVVIGIVVYRHRRMRPVAILAGSRPLQPSCT
jgi:oligosaccharide repeat unit polymerase